jgi:hypothetical protein
MDRRVVRCAWMDRINGWARGPNCVLRHLGELGFWGLLAKRPEPECLDEGLKGQCQSYGTGPIASHGDCRKKEGERGMKCQKYGTEPIGFPALEFLKLAP